MFECMQHSVMFRFAADKMTPAANVRPSKTEDREIVRLCSPAGKKQFVGSDSQQSGQLFARVIDRCPRFASGGMNTGWIPKVAFEVRAHRLQGRLAQWCCRIVIKINHTRGPSCGSLCGR